MDREKMDNTISRLAEIRILLIRDLPFFGHLAMRLGLACAPCRTACTDGSRLIFDPDFAGRLSDQELQFVILHEVLHVVLDHCFRSKGYDSFCYNIACDIVVNSTILDMWGLTSFSVDGQEPMHLVPDGREGRLFNAEEVYQMLLTFPEFQDFIDAHRKSNCGIIDRHDIWDGILDKGRLKAQWDSHILAAVKACGRETMPMGVRRISEKLEKRRKVDWKQLLYDFISYDAYDYTFLPPDKRYSSMDYFLPDFNAQEDISAENIWVCVDTSGSISDEELTQAMHEIQNAVIQIGMNGCISFFDMDITDPVSFVTDEDIKRIEPKGGGGTSFQVIFDYLHEKLCDRLPKLIIIFTDGYAEWPEDEKTALDVPVLWLITEGGKKDAPWGRVAEF